MTPYKTHKSLSNFVYQRLFQVSITLLFFFFKKLLKSCIYFYKRFLIQNGGLAAPNTKATIVPHVVYKSVQTK